MAKPAIFRFMSDPDAFASFKFKNGTEPTYKKLLGLKPLRKSWKGVAVELETRHKNDLGDFPSLVSISCRIFSERALQFLQSLTSDFAETLPLGRFSGQEYFLIHVLEEIDALDEAKSKFLVVDGVEAKGSILNHAFRESLLPGKHIFRIPQLRYRDPLVSKEFKTCVEKNRLQGAKFRKLNS